MPPETEKVALKQLERLKVMQPSSAEYTVTRTYLEWLVELPWSISTEDKLDIQERATSSTPTTTTSRR
jgi:ATP-dependent Lon protease